MRYLTADGSHEPHLTAITERVPAGLPLTAENINVGLERRQGGYGRGGRMKIKLDRAKIASGVRHGGTTGTPITLRVISKDHEKWLDIMAAKDIDDSLKIKHKITHPHPGHADLVGGMKHHFEDLHNSLGRSSAHKTTVRVAAGAMAKHILVELDIKVANHIVVFDGKEIDVPEGLTVSQIKELASQSEVSIVDQEHEQEIKNYIDQIKRDGGITDGVVETVVGGAPVGLGSYVQWDKKLDAEITDVVVSINAFKGVEFGLEFKNDYLRGGQAMGEILWNEGDGCTRRTNNLGGLEGGMTNGQPIAVRGVVKPIPTLYKPLMPADIKTHEPYKATVERSDPIVLPAAGVVMEAVVATVAADEILEKFSSDNLEGLKETVARRRDYVKHF